MYRSWQELARTELAGIKSSRCGWSYRRKGATCVEPTVLACLALVASSTDESREVDLRHSRVAARWLAALQRPDGRLPVSEILEGPGWTTPLALLLWCALADYDAERAHASRWLLNMPGDTGDRDGFGPQVVAKGPLPAGWPWVAGTHSWVEPTATSILALSRAGLGKHERVADGTRMILNRALPRGGWNCGNNIVFGRELRPQPVPTALSLLALAAQGDCSAAAARGVDYLRRVSTTLRAPLSLGWSFVALRAYHALPPEADTALSQAFAQRAGQSDCDPVRSLALLLLASAAESPSVFLSLRSAGPGKT